MIDPNSADMVQRAALALWKIREERLPPRLRRMKPDEMDMESGAWALVVADARASLEAMREPTPAMIDSGVAFALCVTLGGDYRWSEYVADLHRAMTSAALNTTPSETPNDH